MYQIPYKTHSGIAQPPSLPLLPPPRLTTPPLTIPPQVQTFSHVAMTSSTPKSSSLPCSTIAGTPVGAETADHAITLLSPFGHLAKKRKHNGITASHTSSSSSISAPPLQQQHRLKLEDQFAELSESITEMNANITTLMIQQHQHQHRNNSPLARLEPSTLSSAPETDAMAASARQDRRVNSFFSYIADSVNTFPPSERLRFVDDVYKLLRDLEHSLSRDSSTVDLQQ